eukprot:Partr_v1_DN27959_c0_g1_i2_m11212 putative saccharopine dehydrogenase
MLAISCGRRWLTIGIRREQKGKWERRAPLIPSDTALLLEVPNCDGIIVQPSTRRIYSDLEYQNAGCLIQEDLSKADFILGIKEVPAQYLIPNKRYLFFSHTHKGQAHNMPLLKSIIDKNIHLNDYELLTDSQGKRLVAFGKHAGYSGFVNILHGIGQRLLALGYSTPFVNVSRAYNYHSLDEIKQEFRAVGERISSAGGVPRTFSPLSFVFTGDGNVTQGAQELFEVFPHKYVSLKELKRIMASGGTHDPCLLYGVKLQLEDYLVRKDGGRFVKDDYYKYGKEKYKSVFDTDVLPYASCVVHGSYWDKKYPRILETHELSQYLNSKPDSSKILALADISCDVDGPFPFVDHVSTIDEPFFFRPAGLSNSVMLMSVDNLPAELALEATNHFSRCLMPVLTQFFGGKSEILDRATIAKDGKVMEKYEAATKSAFDSHKGPSLKKVLLLGSGRVSLPLVDHFSGKDGCQLTIASNAENELDYLYKSAKGNAPVLAHVDVSNERVLSRLIKDADLVVSFVPAFLHYPVAKKCVEHKKNLVTASYLSPEIASLDADAKEAGIVILNELGLDPGIDHLLAMEFIDKAKEKGGEVTSFISWCGGLPAPENSDNPLGYKFSWSPRGVLTASMNPATYKLNALVEKVEAGGILNTPFDVSIYPGFNFEGVANRDSLKYADIYGMKLDLMKNMFRGTLRYKGFSELMRVLRDIGYLDASRKLHHEHNTWGAVTKAMLGSRSLESVIESTEDKADLIKLTNGIAYLGLLADVPIIRPKSGLQLDAFSTLLERKLKYEKGERDIVCLHHTFQVKYPNSNTEEEHVSGLVAYGDVQGYTAMAKTVALPAAYGADLILENKVSQRGTILPMHREIYQPILEQLRKSLFFVEKRIS